MKASITLPKGLLESARQRAGSQGLSAYLADGLRMAEHMADLDEFLAWREAEFGPIPDDVMNEVREAWPDPRDVTPPSSETQPSRLSSSTATG